MLETLKKVLKQYPLEGEITGFEVIRREPSVEDTQVEEAVEEIGFDEPEDAQAPEQE